MRAYKFSKWILFCALFSVIPFSVLAEFLNVPSQNTYYASSTEASGVLGFTILRPTTDNPTSGFAFFSSKKGTKITFNPEQLLPKESESLVIIFSATSGTEAVLPSGMRSKIEGETLFIMDNLKIFVEPRLEFPYVAVLAKNGESQSIAAFSGTTEIVNIADQDSRVSNLLFPTSLSDALDVKNGEIVLGDVAYSARTLGVAVDRQNACLLSNTVLMSKADLDNFTSGKPVSHAALSLIEALRRGDKLPSFTDKFVPLRVTSKDIVAFDAEAGRGLVLISPSESISGISVCSYSKIQL